ncbi:MAG TPA: hypothetical protein VK797_11610 [Tepidisphaeraceae bacterium]|nr:hypothetical protein [Tepidisphaeraceae bacterium]
MKLSSEGYSPGLLKKIEYAGGNGRSFQTAAQSLERLAEFSISAKHVERLTERLGKERAGLRDKAVAPMKSRTLRSAYKQPPAVAVISVDAGKAQFRQENKGPGVHEAHWGDTKVACLQTYSNVGYDKDPKPDPPEAFLDPHRVEGLCREMERVRGAGGDKQPQEQEPAPKKKQKKRKKPKKRHRPQRPQRLVRTVVATTAAVEAFGWMVSAEAMRRKMYAAKKRAVIGDGGNWIDPLEQMHFPDWVQILDFLHLLVHLYAAARLAYARNAAAAWKMYERMLRDAWGGRVQQVIDTLKSQSERMRADASNARDACHVVELAMQYVERNRQRMDYPRYRRLGLPVSSALVESLIKQINQRVKGTEQFWNTGGLEAVLQVRAAYLSEDDRSERLYEQRPRGPAVGRNRAKAFQQAR